MGDIVNLRQARKRKTRSEDAKRAEANRQRFGQSKSTREQGDTEQARAESFLDGHLLSRPDKGSEE